MAYFANTKYYDDLAETVVEIWAKVEEELIKEIARRVTALGITYTGEYKARLLAEANLLNDRAVELISQYSGISEKQIREVIQKAGLDVVKRDEEIYRQAVETGQTTIEPLPVNQSPRMQAAMNSCVDNAIFGLSNLTATRMIDCANGMESLTKSTRRAYYNAVNRAFLEVRVGGKTTAQAVKQSCMELARQGIQVMHWESGHTDRIEVAARRNIRTAIAQTGGKMTMARMDDYKTDLVEVSSHIGARPSHWVWQGQIYSRSGSGGYPNFYEKTEYGTLLGLCGVNCRHQFFPYFAGTKPSFEQYDEEKNREAYEKTQQQRALERKIRQAKLDKAAAEGLGEDVKPYNAKVRAAQKNMRDWLDKNPEMRRMYDREQIYPANTLTNNGNSNIIINNQQYTAMKTGKAVNDYFYTDTHNEWVNSLSKSEAEAISGYTATDYYDINKYLRKTDGWNNVNVNSVEDKISNLDKAISQYELKDNILVQRGTTTDILDKMLSDFGTPDNEYSQWIGKPFIDEGYGSSTALIGNRVATSKDVVLDIEVPAGKGRGAYINQFAGDSQDTEYEFLLARGSTYVIQSVTDDIDNGKTLIKMRVSE